MARCFFCAVIIDICINALCHPRDRNTQRFWINLITRHSEFILISFTVRSSSDALHSVSLWRATKLSKKHLSNTLDDEAHFDATWNDMLIYGKMYSSYYSMHQPCYWNSEEGRMNPYDKPRMESVANSLRKEQETHSNLSRQVRHPWEQVGVAKNSIDWEFDTISHLKPSLLALFLC